MHRSNIERLRMVQKINLHLKEIGDIKMANIVILGSGGFGTSLAVMTHRYGHNVAVWSAFENEIEAIKRWRT